MPSTSHPSADQQQPDPDERRAQRVAEQRPPHDRAALVRQDVEHRLADKQPGAEDNDARMVREHAVREDGGDQRDLGQLHQGVEAHTGGAPRYSAAAAGAVARTRLRPAYRADAPSPASISSRRLYLATRSDLAVAPSLISPDPVATARSAITVSSVSPERWEMTAL